MTRHAVNWVPRSPADPEEAARHVLLGRVYERIGLRVRAVRAFERARALAGD